MEEGLNNLSLGDLIFDPWFGFGVILELDKSYQKSIVKFYDKQEDKIILNTDEVFFLKNNLRILLKISEHLDVSQDARKHWADMYCIF